MILFNKWLLAFSGFPYPIALTMWHMAFCSTIGFLCVRVGKLVKPHNMTAHDYFRRVMPIGAQPAGDLQGSACHGPSHWATLYGMHVSWSLIATVLP